MIFGTIVLYLFQIFKAASGGLMATLPSTSPLMCVTVTKNYVAMGTEDNQCLLFPFANNKAKG